MGRAIPLKVRSMVGLLPLCAATVFDGRLLSKHPELVTRLRSFIDTRPELGRASTIRRRVVSPGGGSRRSSTRRGSGGCCHGCWIPMNS